MQNPGQIVPYNFSLKSNNKANLKFESYLNRGFRGWEVTAIV